MKRDMIIIYAAGMGIGWMSVSLFMPKNRVDVIVALIILGVILYRQLKGIYEDNQKR